MRRRLGGLALYTAFALACGDDAPSSVSTSSGDAPTSSPSPMSSPSSNGGDTPGGSSSGETGDDTQADTSSGEPPPVWCDDLPGAVTSAALRGHLDALDAIAQANGNNRALGGAGYDASVAYVRERLIAAEHEVVEETFDVNVFTQTGPASLAWQGQQTWAEGEDFSVALYSAPGMITTIGRAVDVQLGPGNGSTSGCEPADFDGFVAGSIALLQRGTCTTASKVVNAQAAGAVGVVIFNQGNSPDRTGPWLSTLGALTDVTVPVLLTRYDVGAAMAQAPSGSVTIAMVVDATVESRPTTNLVVEVGEGDEVIMLGAHLDSVPAGPGINDNGTGSASLLEIATLVRGCPTRRRIRFAWWAAEEVGLVGSTHYVESLDAMARAEIVAYMNFDMLGSPNFVRFRYDGDGSAFGTAGPMGSAELEQVFADFFDGLGLTTEETSFDGRSDYGPFVAAGIAAGGLFTGAEGIKSAEQADANGGAPGLAYDACYHADCDGADNVDDGIHEAMSRAIAHALAVYALP
jgi:Zn-dependent M28 family amino/carboxypeptidase